MTLVYTLMHNSYFTCRLHITLATPLLLCTGDVNLERKKLCEYQTVLHNVHYYLRKKMPVSFTWLMYVLL